MSIKSFRIRMSNNMNQSNAITQNLITHLHADNHHLVGVDIVVSFIKSSGLEKMRSFLNDTVYLGISIRVLTSTYMNITDPVALAELLDILPDGSVRLYNGPSSSFHPKAYFFRYADQSQDYVLIGSSNISRPALVDGVEWNYRLSNYEDTHAYNHYRTEFDKMYANESYELTSSIIKDYRESLVVPEEERRHNNLNKHFKKYQGVVASKKETIRNLYRPNSAQQEALYELGRTMNEGNQTALVVAATGVGKTFLAGFASENYDRILFVAHREEILNQAYDTFAKIRDDSSFGRVHGDFEEVEAEIIFASVQKISKLTWLSQFEPDHFQYIIIDEFHHASADTYQRILGYFKPEFLLGLTATPYRLDGKNIYELCDYNMVYEVDLFSAINRDWLVPFLYYGIYDGTVDYGTVRYINGKYVEKELSQSLTTQERGALVLKHYKKNARLCTLAFCSSIDHAEFMADYFCQNKVKAVAVHSDSSRANFCHRQQAIDDLMIGKINIIFSVDMFNEGVDIAPIDMVMLLRPTESATIFFQQLGRGLRHYDGKLNLKILDFIGNYKNVDFIPMWLAGKNVIDQKNPSIYKKLINQEMLPQNCYIDFDFEVVDLFERVSEKRKKNQMIIGELFETCAATLGHIPSRLEFYDTMSKLDYYSIKQNAKTNPFKDYISFLAVISPKAVPEGFLGSNAHEFLRRLECTNMNRMYKLPVIKAFIEGGQLFTKADRYRISEVFYQFYRNDRNAQDMNNFKSRKGFSTWSLEDYWTKVIRENPIKYLTQSDASIFSYNKQTETLEIILDLGEWANSQFLVDQINDIIRFRRSEFIESRLEK